jgi:hypothetical protein
MAAKLSYKIALTLVVQNPKGGSSSAEFEPVKEN